MTEEGGQGHRAGQDPTCWDSQAIRSRWAGCLLQSCIPSAAPAGLLCKIWVPTCPAILDEVLGVTSHWWVTVAGCCPQRHCAGDWLRRGCWDQHSSACAVINLPGISAKSIPADLWLLCSRRMGSSVSWLALLAFTAS